MQAQSSEFTPSFFNSRNKRIIVWLWLLAAALGYIFIQSIITQEKDRDAKQWEIRLSLLAKSQAQNISAWVQTRFSTLENLTDNMSLKLYMTELSMNKNATPEPDLTVEPAQQTYLRNLLIATARSGGFYQPEPPSTVHANLAKTTSAGLILLDAHAQPIVSTANTPMLADLPTNITKINNERIPLLSEPFLLQNEHLALAFRMPIYGVQDDPNSATPLGYVIGISILDTKFYDLLTSLDQQESTIESIILSFDNKKQQANYLSPLQNGTKPLALTLDTKNPTAEISAALNIGKNMQGIDYRNAPVLAIAASIEHSPWVLVRKIDSKIAMQESLTRSQWILTAYFLLVGLISAAMIAIWKQATMLQARQDANHFKVLAYTLDKQEKLLELIAETTPISTFIVDEKGLYCYANRMAAERASMQRGDMIGKHLEAVLGKARATPILTINQRALDTDTTILNRTQKTNDKGNIEEVIEAQHIPLAEIPLQNSDDTMDGILVIEKDVTELAIESEKHARTLHQIVNTLVKIVDSRDPHAADHSTKVALLSEAIAKEMHLSEQDVTTAKTAGILMNLGKILVPKTILTSTENTDNAHRDHIRQALKASADLLENIEFVGPVVETLRQAQEHVDGTGEPNHLKGNEILITARIINVANDFIAMTSARAWRESISIEDTQRTLLSQIDKKYDQSVVAALINYLYNAGGKAQLLNAK